LTAGKKCFDYAGRLQFFLLELRPLKAKFSTPWKADGENAEYLYNNDRGKQRFSKKNLPSYHFAYCKSNADCPEPEQGFRGENQATIRLTSDTTELLTLSHDNYCLLTVKL
jgi:hypothetical protein